MKSESRNLLEKALADVRQLPTLPVVYSRLQNVLQNPKVSAREVGNVIEQDQALASKLLRIVNSAYYGFPSKISTMSKTVVILGFNEVKHLSLSICILKMFESNQKAGDFDHLEFWRHSIGVAVCAGILAKKSGVSKISSHEEAFVAGLLHDIGLIAQDQYIHGLFVKAVQKKQADNMYLYEAEKEIMGFTHEETGMFLTETWNLPPQLQATTGFHHIPIAKKGSSLFNLVSVVHIADIVAVALGFGSKGDPFVPKYYRECLDALGLTVADIESSIDEIVRVYKEMSYCLIDLK